jgi:hypothetical protein
MKWPLVLLLLALFLCCARAQLYDWTQPTKAYGPAVDCKCPPGSQGIFQFAHLDRCTTANARLSYGEQIVHACNPEPYILIRSDPPQERCLICWPAVGDTQPTAPF